MDSARPEAAEVKGRIRMFNKRFPTSLFESSIKHKHKKAELRRNGEARKKFQSFFKFLLPYFARTMSF